MRTVEVELVLETPQHAPRHAATLFMLLAPEGCTELRQASQWLTMRRRRIGYEPVDVGGTKDVNDTNLLIHTPHR